MAIYFMGHNGSVVTGMPERRALYHHCVTHDLTIAHAGVWPTMLEFFYTDEVQLTDNTVLPLLAMSRELMVKSIEVCKPFTTAGSVVFAASAEP